MSPRPAPSVAPPHCPDCTLEYLSIWTFSLRGVLTFVASGLDINVCVELF